MSCERLDELLDDWLDGTLEERDRHEVEAHLAACPECRERERGLRQVLAHAAALPRSVAPSRDLWLRIAERVGRERTWSWAGLGTGGGRALAAAATVVLALVAVLLVQRSPAPVHTVVIPDRAPEGGGGEARPAAVGIDPNLAAVEADYQAAANALLAALLQRRDELSPETIESVERNLAVIDEALAEVRQALEKDPASPELGRMLVSTHRKKVEVLRQMVRLSTAL